LRETAAGEQHWLCGYDKLRPSGRMVTTLVGHIAGECVRVLLSMLIIFDGVRWAGSPIVATVNDKFIRANGMAD
jgi:hypothetical protein